MERYTLLRDGLPALTFDGELLAAAGKRPDRKGRMRWHSFKLFDADLTVDTLILGVHFHSEVPGEGDTFKVLVGTLDEVLDQVDEQNWIESVTEFPPAERFDARRADRKMKIERQAHAALSQLWHEAGIEMVIKTDISGTVLIEDLAE